MNHNLGKTGQLGGEFVPKPASHHLDGGVFQPWHIVQIAVVEFLDDRLHRGADEGMVVEPAGIGIHFAFDGNFDREGMAVQPRALVASGHFREALSGFENEIFGEADFHGGVLYRGRPCIPI